MIDVGQIHHVVDDQEIERPFREQPLRASRSSRLDDIVALGAERPGAVPRHRPPR